MKPVELQNLGKVRIGQPFIVQGLVGRVNEDKDTDLLHIHVMLSDTTLDILDVVHIELPSRFPWITVLRSHDVVFHEGQPLAVTYVSVGTVGASHVFEPISLKIDGKSCYDFSSVRAYRDKLRIRIALRLWQSSLPLREDKVLKRYLSWPPNMRDRFWGHTLWMFGRPTFELLPWFFALFSAAVALRRHYPTNAGIDLFLNMDPVEQVRLIPDLVLHNVAVVELARQLPKAPRL